MISIRDEQKVPWTKREHVVPFEPVGNHHDLLKALTQAVESAEFLLRDFNGGTILMSNRGSEMVAMDLLLGEKP